MKSPAIPLVLGLVIAVQQPCGTQHKAVCYGEKNWLFVNTPAGAQSSAVIYSLIETAKENRLDPYRYLLWVWKPTPSLFETGWSWAQKLLPACAPEDCKMK